VQLRYQGGYTEDLLLDALPRAFAPQRFRTAATEAAYDLDASEIQQFAELAPENLTGFTVVGLIKFAANEPPAEPEVVGPDDCKVSVSVFTDAPGQPATPISSIRSAQGTQTTTIRSAQQQGIRRPRPS
jgi:hypothetical protein